MHATKQYAQEGLDAFWQRPHIQELLKTVEADEDEDTELVQIGTTPNGYPKWGYPSHFMKERWRQTTFTITLYGQTFQGIFEEPDWYDNAYTCWLIKNERLPALRQNCKRESEWMLHGIPIEQGEVETVDEYGWPVYISILPEEILIVAHIVCFQMEVPGAENA